MHGNTKKYIQRWSKNFFLLMLTNFFFAKLQSGSCKFGSSVIFHTPFNRRNVFFKWCLNSNNETYEIGFQNSNFFRFLFYLTSWKTTKLDTKLNNFFFSVGFCNLKSKVDGPVYYEC